MLLFGMTAQRPRANRVPVALSDLDANERSPPLGNSSEKADGRQDCWLLACEQFWLNGAKAHAQALFPLEAEMEALYDDDRQATDRK